ncbi:SAM-dependent methyltransferase [Streptomyces sp. NPDC049954]|uniref:SAM-dependent methyltransferase n=1 Tax=Streptomyces sp. NPDC049954 TaxID=3155779 RepID=UPI003416AC19
MTSTLVRKHRPRQGDAPSTEAQARAARDWAEIQERMLVPLYEAVYDRVEVGPGARLLGLGCGSGLALLLAARRGAAVTGVDGGPPERLALARERLLGERAPRTTVPGTVGAASPDHGAPSSRVARPTPGVPECAPSPDAESPRLLEGGPADAAGTSAPPYTVVTAFQPAGATAGDYEELTGLLASAVPLTARGGNVVLAGWGPPERCAASAVLRVATRLTDADASLPFGPGELGAGRGWRPERRDDLEALAFRVGLRLEGSGRVACPFGYADGDSAVRGLLSTGLFDAAVEATDSGQVRKELREALHPYTRLDGTVWMPNVFRYVIATRP